MIEKLMADEQLFVLFGRHGREMRMGKSPSMLIEGVTVFTLER